MQASKDGFPTAVIAQRALCFEGISAHWLTRLPGGQYYARAAAVSIQPQGSIWCFPQTYRNDNSASC
jgi:hypothetical protein